MGVSSYASPLAGHIAAPPLPLVVVDGTKATLPLGGGRQDQGERKQGVLHITIHHPRSSLTGQEEARAHPDTRTSRP